MLGLLTDLLSLVFVQDAYAQDGRSNSIWRRLRRRDSIWRRRCNTVQLRQDASIRWHRRFLCSAFTICMQCGHSCILTVQFYDRLPHALHMQVAVAQMPFQLHRVHLMLAMQVDHQAGEVRHLTEHQMAVQTVETHGAASHLRTIPPPIQVECSKRTTRGIQVQAEAQAPGVQHRQRTTLVLRQRLSLAYQRHRPGVRKVPQSQRRPLTTRLLHLLHRRLMPQRQLQPCKTMHGIRMDPRRPLLLLPPLTHRQQLPQQTHGIRDQNDLYSSSGIVIALFLHVSI